MNEIMSKSEERTMQLKIEDYLCSILTAWLDDGNKPKLEDELLDMVINHFRPTTEEVEEHSIRYPEDRTLLGTKVHFAINNLKNDKLLIRVGENLVQVNSETLPTPFNEAKAFLKHARKIGYTLEEAKAMVTDKWDSETLDKAGKVAYA